ncbi:MAG: TasA family protein [Terracoccus sp.]
MIANRHKVILPLATLVAAAAVAVGSGATFTSQSSNTISSVTSGTLTQSNSKSNAAIFTLTNMKPGDTVNGDLTITNTGTLPAAFSLTEVSSTNAFSADNLTLKISNTTSGTVVYDGTFGGLKDGVKNDLGTFAPSASGLYRFTVKLSADAANVDQGKSASAVYQWDATQLAADTSNQ